MKCNILNYPSYAALTSMVQITYPAVAYGFSGESIFRLYILDGYAVWTMIQGIPELIFFEG